MCDMVEPMKHKPPKRKRSFFDWRYIPVEKRRHYQWAAILFGSILTTFLIHWNVISMGVITDISMRPTLRPGDTYLINKYIYHFKRPGRGDIVILRPRRYAADQYVKRVIALAGETLAVIDRKVYVNGELLAEPYVAGFTFPNMEPLQIPPESCFVMGDNRLYSEDSRQFGSVPFSNIEGKIKPGELFSWN